MKLEEIGFYTLEDNRAKNSSSTSPLWRCELLLTDRCNFNCPYCRGVRKELSGDIDFSLASKIVQYWCDEELKNIRFSGGEPTLYPFLDSLVIKARKGGVERIALSTNGSSKLDYYKYLIDCGVNDFSISLDACCSSFGDKMSGVCGEWENVVKNIKELSKLTYVTTGVVFTNETEKDISNIINFANSLEVSDIRIISSAQYNENIDIYSDIDKNILKKYPILRYRINNFRKGKNVRGINGKDTNKCYLCLDDMAIINGYHYPCIIYLREGGNPIGYFDKNTREDRRNWFLSHDTKTDSICRKNCLDVCVDYNNKAMALRNDSN